MSSLPSHRRLFRSFLSHAHVDKVVVDGLYDWLKNVAEVPVWYDAYNLAASSTIATELPDAISLSRSMIIVLSNAAISSGWVKEEYSAAIQERTEHKQYRIIPICIEKCEVPGFLRTIKYINLVEKKLDLESASEIIGGLYYDNKTLQFETTQDVYISRSWSPAEADLANHICRLLDKNGFRLVGDSDDQRDYDIERVKSLISSCGGLVAILPDRGQGKTSKFILQEIEIARNLKLPYMIVAEPTVNLSEDLAQIAIRISVDKLEENESNVKALQHAIEELGYSWRRLTQEPYVFYATDLDEEHARRNLIIKQAIQHITATRCVIGDKIPTSHIREAITERISQAFLVIADISNNNLNSCIEAGIAIGAKRPLVLLSSDSRPKPPFMLSNYQVFPYKDDLELLGIIHKIAFPYRRRILNSEVI